MSTQETRSSSRRLLSCPPGVRWPHSSIGSILSLPRLCPAENPKLCPDRHEVRHDCPDRTPSMVSERPACPTDEDRSRPPNGATQTSLSEATLPTQGNIRRPYDLPTPVRTRLIGRSRGIGM